MKTRYSFHLHRYTFILPPSSFLLLFSSFILPPSSFLFADQVGIDKVRLFETELGRYVLEVDTSARLAAAYREPVLPERFELTGFQRDRQPGYLVLRYRFRSQGEPLTVGDELLLPWGRSGASITAQWSDGSVHQNLFLRDFEGIRVPIEMLKPSQPSMTQLAQRCAKMGLTHAGLGWNHWLLVAAVGLLASGWWRIGLMVWFAAGHAISLVLTDLGALVVPVEVAEICIAMVAVLIARAAPLESDQWGRFVPVMLILGALHGIANAKMLGQTGVGENDLVRALFVFNLSIDVLQMTAAVIVAALATVVSVVFRGAKGDYSSVVRVAVGGAASGVLLIALAGGLSHRSNGTSPRTVDSFELPGAQMVSPGMGAPARPPRILSEPVASFLTIEPYEIRLEVLVRIADAREWINLPEDQETIEIDQQETTTGQLVDLIDEETVVSIDGNEVSPDIERAYFVTVEPGGVFSRPAPVPEPLDSAVVGITFVYDTIVMPEQVQLDWNLFSSELRKIAATIADPFGGRQHELSPDNSQLFWENRWSGYRPPDIKPVAVSKPRFPLMSVLLAIIAFGIYWLLVRGRHGRLPAMATAMLLTAAFIMYPFVRISVGAPLAVAWKPSSEEASHIQDRLLTNVYRAYDMRDEEEIYDRLALTITGEQLTEIFLDTRRSLELENRGGARAKVDEVEILEVHSIKHADDGGFAVDLEWTVSGSVTHFGHTHYRRNRYRAVVVMLETGGYWKIQSIQVVEQQRVL